MGKKCLLAILISPLFLVAQEQGISFQHNVPWQTLLQKAKAEKKYVFVDCYASWCGPCKVMDKYIYSNDSVGRLMNDNFISVKIQMDSTGKDEKDIQNWYTEAK